MSLSQAALQVTTQPLDAAPLDAIPVDAVTRYEAAMLAAMPQAPGRYHPVREKERVTERRNYVLREMWQNGYIDEATYLVERDAPLQSVQNGDFVAFRQVMPPRGQCLT